MGEVTGPSDTLEPFRTAHARELAGWAATAAEARRWGGQDVVWPVAASVFSAWHADLDVRPFVLSRSGVLLGYGEVWIDAEEHEVELARIIVRPGQRGRGIGRLLVTLLLEQAAETGYRAAFVRVAPDNAAALACYRHAGFAPVGEEERLAFNEGQPLEYVWLRHELR
jgi:ribosomal protein S18 acetylase RimI-like enzyme